MFREVHILGAAGQRIGFSSSTDHMGEGSIDWVRMLRMLQLLGIYSLKFPVGIDMFVSS